MQACVSTFPRTGARRFLLTALGALALAGCAQKPLIQRAVPLNPFGNTRASAVCHTSPVTTATNGAMQVAMTVRSDGGTCALAVQQPGGGNYTSFGVDPAPDHGKAFIYNYDGQTYVTYTPNLAFAGSDAFTAVLIQGPGQPRLRLSISATDDATGVVLPKPPVPVAAPAAKTTGKAAKATSRTHRRTKH